MKSTALGAENIIFISDAHEKFYYEKLQEVRYMEDLRPLQRTKARQSTEQSKDWQH